METNEIDNRIKEILTNCEKNALVFICQTIQTEYGMDYCIGRIKDILLKNNNFTIKNAIAHLEIELIEQKLY